MQIRFRCKHCKKVLGVKKELAGKKAKCPVCKKPIVIPTPTAVPVDAEALAMAALADEPAPAEAAPQAINFDCQFCGEAISMGLDMGGKREPCPHCRRIVRVPVPENKKDDWRTIKQSGPSGALINQQEKLEGEWGTQTSKGSVTRESLEEADAILIPDEPFSLSKWIKRGVLVVVLVGVAVAAALGFNQQQRSKDQKASVETVLALLKEAKESTDPKTKLPTEWVAAIQRGLGEFYLGKTGKGMLDKARTGFYEAWGAFPPPTRLTRPSIDRELLLIRIAENTVALGGSDENARDKEKIAWKDMPKQFAAIVDRIQFDMAKAQALRRVGAKLTELKQEPTYVTLVSQVQPPGANKDLKSPILAQLIAALVGQDQLDAAKKRVPPPVPMQPIVDLVPRLGYAEGHAHKGDYPAAQELVQAVGGVPLDPFRTALSVADYALATNAENEAKPLLSDAVKICETRPQAFPPWELLQLSMMLAETGDTEKSQQLAKFLDKDHQAWAEYAQFRARLKVLTTEAKSEMAQEIKKADSLPRALAWEDISRHNTRLGYRDAMKTTLDYPDDPRIKAFIHLGFALGEQDRDR